MKLKIMVDLDGVIWDIMRVFLRIYNRIYTENVKYEDIDGWYYFPQERFEHVYPLTLPWIMDYPVFDKFVGTYIYDLNIGNDVSILTAEANSEKVLKKKLESIHIDEGTHYDKIIRTEPNENKLNYEADIYIDDNPNMADKMHEYPDRYLLLYNQPWNQEFNDIKTDNVWRVFTWDGIMLAIELIKLIKKRKLM